MGRTMDFQTTLEEGWESWLNKHPGTVGTAQHPGQPESQNCAGGQPAPQPPRLAGPPWRGFSGLTASRGRDRCGPKVGRAPRWQETTCSGLPTPPLHGSRGHWPCVGWGWSVPVAPTLSHSGARTS